MRLSTANIFDTSIATLQRRQQQMQNSQVQLTSGKKIALASDDPTGAARAERAMATISRVDANQRALEASRNGTNLGEAALGDANELLQQMRETMVSAGNASYSDSERVGLANKISGLRDQLLAIANRGDGAGGFLFSGQGSSDPPFLDQAGGVRFNGISGSIQTGNIDSFPLTVDGRMAFEQARSGNGTFETIPKPNQFTGGPPKGWIDAGRVADPALLTGHSYQINISGSAPATTYDVIDLNSGGSVQSGPYLTGKAITFDGMAVTLTGALADGDQFDLTPSTNSLKLFDVLDRTVAELRMPLRAGAEITQSNSGRVRDIDAVMVNLQNVRSQLGERLNNLDGTEGRMAALKQYNQAERSAAEDLDMVQGISDFQNQQNGYDTALKTYAMVQRMSLFQYINS
ncbi:flagellar hook-associated protein FlgL [Roseateles oligotrophus]|uniref:Flagellar hook-associated protein FlgL n=1 Tax=Roseateles oligotrophus TaxID=1769250 RepID=A0ABT2YAQ3_9BURK|nr:flagellar hook-associated protein FlgL [Roseateles oligotrophus]MCV2367381.1 flagellar hook-associated protein FlgL [Roseateles oligotrophus]